MKKLIRKVRSVRTIHKVGRKLGIVSTVKGFPKESDFIVVDGGGGCGIEERDVQGSCEQRFFEVFVRWKEV